MAEICQWFPIPHQFFEDPVIRCGSVSGIPDGGASVTLE
jgi:hypothetical protein